MQNEMNTIVTILLNCPSFLSVCRTQFKMTVIYLNNARTIVILIVTLSVSFIAGILIGHFAINNSTDEDFTYQDHEK